MIWAIDLYFMIDFESFTISAYSGVLKFDIKIFVNVARLKMGQLFTQDTRQRHTLDTFLVLLKFEQCGFTLFSRS